MPTYCCLTNLQFSCSSIGCTDLTRETSSSFVCALQRAFESVAFNLSGLLSTACLARRPFILASAEVARALTTTLQCPQNKCDPETSSLSAGEWLAFSSCITREIPLPDYQLGCFRRLFGERSRVRPFATRQDPGKAISRFPRRLLRTAAHADLLHMMSSISTFLLPRLPPFHRYQFRARRCFG